MAVNTLYYPLDGEFGVVAYDPSPDDRIVASYEDRDARKMIEEIRSEIKLIDRRARKYAWKHQTRKVMKK